MDWRDNLPRDDSFQFNGKKCESLECCQRDLNTQETDAMQWMAILNCSTDELTGTWIVSPESGITRSERRSVTQGRHREDWRNESRLYPPLLTIEWQWKWSDRDSQCVKELGDQRVSRSKMQIERRTLQADKQTKSLYSNIWTESVLWRLLCWWTMMILDVGDSLFSTRTTLTQRRESPKNCSSSRLKIRISSLLSLTLQSWLMLSAYISHEENSGTNSSQFRLKHKNCIFSSLVVHGETSCPFRVTSSDIRQEKTERLQSHRRLQSPFKSSFRFRRLLFEKNTYSNVYSRYSMRCTLLDSGLHALS